MRAAPVFALLVLSIGFAGLAGPLSGTTEISLGYDKTDLLVFDSAIDLDYAISNVTFGATAIFDIAEFRYLGFDSQGALGPIKFQSVLSFDPEPAEFDSWSSAAKVKFGGTSVFGLFMLDDHNTSDLPIGAEAELGAGAALGITATFGEVSMAATSVFNMDLGFPFVVYSLGYDLAVSLAGGIYKRCGQWHWAMGYNVLEPGCDLHWSGALISVDFPLACHDVRAVIAFGSRGFDGLLFSLTDIETGLPWLRLAYLLVEFSTRRKDAFFDLGFAAGEAVCVTPYVSVASTDGSVDGLTLNALLFECNLGGVTVKAGDIFDNVWLVNDEFYLDAGIDKWGSTLDGDLAPAGAAFPWQGCVYELDYDEFIRIWTRGDGCCGGYDLGIVVFFDTSQTGAVFDWAETVASFETSLGTNVTAGLSMSAKADGVQWLQVRGEFSF